MDGFDFGYIINTNYYPAVVRKGMLIFGVFLGIFYFCRKGGSLGFNREKLLDLAIFPIAAALLSYNFLMPFKNLRLGLSLLAFILMLSYQTKKLSWSYPRILDISSEGASLALIFFPIGSLIFNLAFLIQYILLRDISLHGQKSGLISYLFFIIFSAVVFIIEGSNRYFISFNMIFAFAILFISLIRLKSEGYFVEMARLGTLGVRPLSVLVIVISKIKSLNLSHFRNEIMDKKRDNLNVIEIEKIKESLLRKKIELDEQEKNLNSESLFLDPGKVGSNAEEQDEAFEQNEYEKTLLIISETKKSKEDVENALRKIDQDKFGFCEKCPGLINKDRLEAYPEARFCITCSGKF